MSENAAETFGDYIRRLRKAVHLTQRELAKRTVLSSGYIARIETDSSTPRKREILASLADGLGVHEDEVVSKAKITTTSRKTLVREYRRFFDLILTIDAICKRHSTPLTTLNQKLAVFKEPRLEVARKFLAVYEGDLGYDEIPPSGSRPVSHYFRPFCNEDYIKWDPQKMRMQRSVGERNIDSLFR